MCEEIISNDGKNDAVEHSEVRYLSGMPHVHPGPPRQTRRRRRLSRHLLIVGGSALGGGCLAWVLPGPLRERVSLASAYVALTLLAITLSLGPLNVLRGRPNPVSFDRRRDFGIWTAIVGVLHTAIGLTVHLKGRMWQYFLPVPDGPHLLGLRADPFGAANYAGLVAALLLILLAAISNDLALRRLGTSRWRAIQRWAYLLLALTIAHGALYQVMESQRVVLVVGFAILVVSVLGLQAAARRHLRGDARN